MKGKFNFKKFGKQANKFGKDLSRQVKRNYGAFKKQTRKQFSGFVNKARSQFAQTQSQAYEMLRRVGDTVKVKSLAIFSIAKQWTQDNMKWFADKLGNLFTYIYERVDAGLADVQTYYKVTLRKLASTIVDKFKMKRPEQPKWKFGSNKGKFRKSAAFNSKMDKYRSAKVKMATMLDRGVKIVGVGALGALAAYGIGSAAAKSINSQDEEEIESLNVNGD